MEDKEEPNWYTKDELLATGEYTGTGKYESERKAREEAEKQLQETIEKLSQVAGDQEALKKQLEEVQEGAKKREQESEQQVKRLAVQSKLDVAGAQDASIVMSLVDMSFVRVLSDGAVEGLDEQLNRIKNEKPFLFKTAESPPVVGGTPTQPQVKTQGKATSAIDELAKRYKVRI